MRPEPFEISFRYVRSFRFSLFLWSALPLIGVAAESGGLITGELKQWHKVTLTIPGPQASEIDASPNPFADYRMTVTFSHESGTPHYTVPGYFAADGDAANSSADSGDKWRAHLSPDKAGKWDYRVSFVKGSRVAVNDSAGIPVPNCDGLSGHFSVTATDKSGRDFRAKGRLQYVGKRYLQFAGSREYFLKAGPDSPENLLAYTDFDGTYAHKSQGVVRPGEAATTAIKTWQAHERDWREGDPTWKGGKGKGLLGALNYLASRGCNSISFLTYNAGGDGDDVWPFVARDRKLHYDCSKLDQWQIVFDRATALGLFCHFKTQETENDDLNGPGAAQSLDGGDLGVERKLYYRELVARFAHLQALNWNLGEENTQTPEQQRAAARFLHKIDPYKHPIVIHTYPTQQDRVYSKLTGSQSLVTGASLQNGWSRTHQQVLKWVTDSEHAGRPWIVANDEQNPPAFGVPPDPGYAGFQGTVPQKDGEKAYDLHAIRKHVLWGSLMAGGHGVEYYFGYALPQNDLGCEDFRSREQSWGYCRIALEFFQNHRIPFWEMTNANALIGNTNNNNSRYCFAKPGELYLIYLPQGGTTTLDLAGAGNAFSVQWFDPRNGSNLRSGSVAELLGGNRLSIGDAPEAPDQDWLVLVQRKP